MAVPETIDIPVRLTLAEGDAQITRLSVDPGDTIVITCSDHITREQAASLKSLVAPYFPDNECIVLGGGLHMTVVKPTS